MKRPFPDDGQVEPNFATNAPDAPDALDAAAYTGRLHPVRHRGNAVVAWGFVVILLVALGFMALLGFEPLKQQLHATQALLAEANRNVASLQRQISTLETYRGNLQKERDGLANQVIQHGAELAALQTASQQINDLFTVDINRGNIVVRQMEDELAIDVANDVLFGTTDAALSKGGKFILLKVASALRQVSDRVIEVGGHTDSQALAAKLVHHYPTNWELSCVRAAEIVRFLEESAGIQGDHLVAAGYAGTRPIAQNEHAPGRRRNQRIGIIVRPKAHAAANLAQPER